MPVPHQPTLRTAAQGRTIAVVGDVYRFLATGEDTNGTYALWEAIVPPGGGPPPHVHSREEEGFYVLEGEITFIVNGEKIVATAGTFANMPVGTPHSFKNESDRPAKMLISVRDFFDPRYLKKHGLTDRDIAFEVLDGPSFQGIHNIVVADDRRTVLCILDTKAGKELFVLRWVVYDGHIYISPENAPDPKTGIFKPWILRTKVK